jgi:hypothetical protein
MFFGDELLARAEERLREICPSPEDELALLGTILATLSGNESTARLRRIALDIDDLCSQVRWHLGQALLILNSCPNIAKAGEQDAEYIRRAGFHAGALLLLRAYRLGADRVMYSDLSEARAGGTVGGWIFHMLIDSAIHRCVSALDRIAAILWTAADLPPSNVYFRSKKLARIHGVFGSTETAELVRLAETPLFECVIAYRDRLTHTTKAYTRAAGFSPAESWTDNEGRRVAWAPDALDANTLFGLGNAAYHQFVDALKLCNPVLERRWPIPKELQ